MFEVEEEEVVSKAPAKKNKPEAVRSAAPPKKAAPVEKKVEELKLDDKKQSSKEKEEVKQVKKEKTESYSDEWGADDDLDLEDKGAVPTNMNNPQSEMEAPKNNFGNLNDDFFNVEEDPILNNN